MLSFPTGLRLWVMLMLHARLRAVSLAPFPILQVDYYLGLQADMFIGNSVSTFTAFIILERQWLGRYAGWQR